MIRIYLLSLVFLLSGCSTFFDPNFEVNPKTTKTIIYWVIVNDVDQFCRHLMKDKNPSDGRIYGCASYYADLSRCIIYTEKYVSLETLGHEFRHCFEGRWHD